MTDSLRTDYDRMVGESCKDYAARCRGRMLAAEHDRDALRARVAELGALDRERIFDILSPYYGALTNSAIEDITAKLLGEA